MTHRRMICLLLALAACAALAGCGFSVSYDNSTPAQELVSEVYDSKLKDALVDENGVCRFDTLDELAEHFKLECARAPQEYRQSYEPYAVLLFDDGSRAFVFFDPDSFEIAKCLVVDKFTEHDAMAEKLDELQKSNAAFDEWRALDKYNTGMSTASKMHGHCIAVSDGVFVVVLGNGNNPQVKMTDFMSDEDLFGTSLPDDRIACDLYTVWPLLPIDKDFNN